MKLLEQCIIEWHKAFEECSFGLFLSHRGIPKSSGSWMTITQQWIYGDLRIPHFKWPPAQVALNQALRSSWGAPGVVRSRWDGTRKKAAWAQHLYHSLRWETWPKKLQFIYKLEYGYGYIWDSVHIKFASELILTCSDPWRGRIPSRHHFRAEAQQLDCYHDPQMIVLCGIIPNDGPAKSSLVHIHKRSQNLIFFWFLKFILPISLLASWFPPPTQHLASGNQT